ncbi:MFS transporter [Chloroflexota bacterium]
MHQSNQSNEGAKREGYWALMLTSLRYRNFRLVWLGSFTEHIGENMQMIAILWLTNELTHSPLWLGIVGTARFWPMLFMPFIGGVVADRVDRRYLLIATLLGASLLSMCLTILTITGLIAVGHLIAISLLGGIVTSFNHPARHAIVPNLIRKEHLMNAIALDSMSVHASRIIAAPIGGYLIALAGVWPVFALRAIGCLLAIVWLLMARVPPTPPTAKKEKPWRSFTAGLGYMRANLIILALVLLYLVPRGSAQAVTNFMPVFAENILSVGAIGYGYLQAAPGLGAILSLLGLTLLTYYKRKTLLFAASGIILGIGLIGFSASPWVFLSLALLVIVGGVQTAFNTLNSTVIQGAIPDEVRGRVLSWREIMFGLGPTLTLLVGALAENVGMQLSLGLVGGVCLLVSLILVFYLPRFRSIE